MGDPDDADAKPASERIGEDSGAAAEVQNHWFVCEPRRHRAAPGLERRQRDRAAGVVVACHRVVVDSRHLVVGSLVAELPGEDVGEPGIEGRRRRRVAPCADHEAKAVADQRFGPLDQEQETNDGLRVLVRGL
jgi:hypothetical protein